MESPSYSTVKKWAAEFKRERKSDEDDRRSGRAKDSIASEVGISFGAVQLILTDILDMPNVSPRWVPRMLTDD